MSEVWWVFTKPIEGHPDIISSSCSPWKLPLMACTRLWEKLNGIELAKKAGSSSSWASDQTHLVEPTSIGFYSATVADLQTRTQLFLETKAAECQEVEVFARINLTYFPSFGSTLSVNFHFHSMTFTRAFCSGVQGFSGRKSKWAQPKMNKIMEGDTNVPWLNRLKGRER